MARIVIEKSPIADFLDELPGLLLQYKQLQYAQEERDLDREARKVERAQSFVLKEYYDKKAEVQKTEAMYDKYQGISPKEMTDGGMDLVNIIDEQNNLDMKAITGNLDALSSYQSQLTAGLNELSEQSQILQEIQLEYAGPEGVLQKHEYEKFREDALKSIDEGGLGWATTAGADVEFYKTDPTTREDLAYRMTERYTKEAKVGATGSYALLQSIFTPGDKEDTGDLVNKFTYEDASGKDVAPSEEVVAAIQRMAGQNVTYDDFLANLNAYPAEAGGDLIRGFLESNPNTAMIYGNLKKDAEMITTLDNELAGINETDQATDLDNFVSGISNISDKNILFGLYDQAVLGKDPALHGQFFNAIEAQLGSADAGEEYMKYKGFYDPNDPEEPKDVGTLIPSQKELALSTLSSINKEIAVDSTYLAEYDDITESLDEIQDYSYDRFLELAKIDPDNVDPWLLPSRARMVWWGMMDPSNDIEEEIARLGGEHRGAAGLAHQRPLKYPVERSLEENRAKRIEMEKTLKLLEGSD